MNNLLITTKTSSNKTKRKRREKKTLSDFALFSPPSRHVRTIFSPNELARAPVGDGGLHDTSRTRNRGASRETGGRRRDGRRRRKLCIIVVVAVDVDVDIVAAAAVRAPPGRRARALARLPHPTPARALGARLRATPRRRLQWRRVEASLRAKAACGGGGEARRLRSGEEQEE